MVSCHKKPDVHYVYLDLQGVLHATQGCKAVTKYHNAQPVKPLPMIDVKPYMLDKICSRCVDESSMLTFEKIAEINNDIDTCSTLKCILTVDGRQRTIDFRKFDENIDAFVCQFPNATIRMKDKKGKVADIKLNDLSDAFDIGYEYVVFKTYNIDKLYKRLKAEGYDDLGTQQQFREFLQDGNNIKRLYNLLFKAGYQDIGSENEFARWLKEQ